MKRVAIDCGSEYAFRNGFLLCSVYITVVYCM